MPTRVHHYVLNNVQVLTIGHEELSISEDFLEEISHQLLDYTVSVPPQIVVDMQHVVFFGSSFIETLFRMWNRVKSSKNGRFALAGLQTYCQEVLSVTNLDSLWEIYPDVESAISAIASSDQE